MPASLPREAAKEIAVQSGAAVHDIALIIGSGWVRAADLLGRTRMKLRAEAVPGFSTSGVPGHSGTISSIEMPNGRSALVIGARTHYYEG